MWYETMNVTLHFFFFNFFFLQILNLGSGFDALYFKLKSAGRLENTLYIEVFIQNLNNLELKPNVFSLHLA